MTTPGPSPSVFILNGTSPVQVVARSTQSAPYLLANQDLQNNVYISTSNSVAPGSTNVWTIEPLGTIALTSASQWWACTDPGVNTEVDVLPGGTNWAPAPSEIAAVIAPLAAAIAQQIFATGVPVIPAPVVVYKI